MFMDKPAVPFSEGDQCLYLFYFPWLQLDETIQINQLSMLPFPSGECDAVLGHENDWLRKHLQSLKKIYLNHNGEPVSKLTMTRGYRCFYTEQDSAGTRLAAGSGAQYFAPEVC